MARPCGAGSTQLFRQAASRRSVLHNCYLPDWLHRLRQRRDRCWSLLIGGGRRRGGSRRAVVGRSGSCCPRPWSARPSIRVASRSSRDALVISPMMNSWTTSSRTLRTGARRSTPSVSREPLCRGRGAGVGSTKGPGGRRRRVSPDPRSSGPCPSWRFSWYHRLPQRGRSAGLTCDPNTFVKTYHRRCS